VAVTEFDATSAETSHRYPEFLPDGVHFLYLVEARTETEGSEGGFTLFAGSTESKDRRRVVATNASARYAKSGHVLFLRDRTLLAQRFDADKLAMVGDAVPVAENMTRTNRWEATFSLSDDGLLAFQSGAATELSQLVWTDREGRDLGTAGKPADYRSIALSHDGRRVATQVLDPKTQKSDIWVLDLDRGTSTRLTFDPADDFAPVWSADDRWVYFCSTRQGRGDVFRKSSTGTGTDEVVLADPEWSMLWSVTADGRTGAVMTNNSAKKTGWDIAILDLATAKTRVFLETPFNELGPRLSSDGRWLAYFTNESGQSEVFVQSLGDGGGKWQISTDGGSRPRFSRDDGTLVFQSNDDKLMSVSIRRTPDFAASVPKILADPKLRQLVAMQYDLSPDGARILVNRALDQPVVTPVTLVQHWTEGLGQ
jgi:hypothetical protein